MTASILSLGPSPRFGSTAKATDPNATIPSPANSPVKSPIPAIGADKASQTQAVGVVPGDQFEPKKNSKAGFWDMPSVEMTLRTVVPDPHTVPMDMLRHIFVQQAMHPEEKGRLKILMNNMGEPIDTSMFGLHDNLFLLDKPVDIVVKSHVYKSGLAALVHPKVRSFMTPGASITHQNFDNQASYQKNSQIQTERWLQEQSNQTLATQIIKKAGNKTERKKLVDTLKARDGVKSWSAFEALHMGIIDGILVGNNDRVITSKNLEAFLKKQKEEHQWTEKDVASFLQDSHRASELPSQPLHVAFPESVPTPEKTLAPLKPDASSPKLFTREMLKSKSKLSRGDLPPEQEFKLPQNCLVSEAPKFPSPAYIMKNIDKSGSVLSNNAAFYTAKVDLDPINRLIQTLERFDVQRRIDDSKHHLALFLNCPMGGDGTFGQMFMDTLQRLKTPVDIILTGSAVSAGSMHLLVGGTGKRLATPSTFIMVHENAGFAKASEVANESKQFFESTLRRLAYQTGRPLSEVRRDTAKDYWLSPIEALFYGKKGLLDGILVGPRHVITRDDVMEHLKEKWGSEEAVMAKINERLERRRDMTEELDHKFNPENPLDNAYDTIMKVAQRKSRVLGEDAGFLHSGPDPEARNIEHVPVKAFKPFKLPFKFMKA